MAVGLGGVALLLFIFFCCVCNSGSSDSRSRSSRARPPQASAPTPTAAPEATAKPDATPEAEGCGRRPSRLLAYTLAKERLTKPGVAKGLGYESLSVGLLCDGPFEKAGACWYFQCPVTGMSASGTLTETTWGFSVAHGTIKSAAPVR